MSVDIPCHNFVRVEVVDTGIGIAAENVSKLFNQVIQIDAQRNQNGGGSGFGLLIAKKIVGMHDGYIGMSSNGLGEGSCFYFEIPIVEILPEASHPHSTEWFAEKIRAARGTPARTTRAHHRPCRRTF